MAAKKKGYPHIPNLPNITEGKHSGIQKQVISPISSNILNITKENIFKINKKHGLSPTLPTSLHLSLVIFIVNIALLMFDLTGFCPKQTIFIILSKAVFVLLR